MDDSKNRYLKGLVDARKMLDSTIIKAEKIGDGSEIGLQSIEDAIKVWNMLQTTIWVENAHLMVKEIKNKRIPIKKEWNRCA